MKFRTLLVLLLLVIPARQFLFAQGNSCELFVKGYASRDGLKDFRPAGAEDGKSFDVDTALLRNYELASGVAYLSLGGQSWFDTSYNYTPWRLELETARNSTGNKFYKDVKQTLDPWFANVIDNLSKGCLVQLQHSPVFFASDENAKEVSWVYFYPKQVTIPQGATDEETKAALNEIPYLKVVLNIP
jgi:hypothetical protein